LRKINITETEKGLLQNYVKSSSLILVRYKSQAVLLASVGVTSEQMSSSIDRTPDTIDDWLGKWVKYRLSSIFSGHKGNQNAAELTIDQKKQISETLKSPPSEYGLPKEFWDVPTLKEYTKAEFGVEYECKQSYHFLLKFSGLSFKYPDTLSPRRGDDNAITSRLLEIRAEIKDLKTKYSNMVFYSSDETRLQYQSEIRRAWLKTGERTIVKTERSKLHQNYLGFLNNDTGELINYEIARGNQLETIRVLEQLTVRHPTDQPICIIWDNAKWHKGKLLREALARDSTLARIHLINFAPYAPDTNPIEHVWQWAKSQLANRDSGDWQKLKAEFNDLLKSRTFEYKI
jgi:transposase